MTALDKPQLAILAASLVAAFGLGLVVPDGGSKPDAPPPQTQPANIPLDVAKYHAEVKAYRAAHPTAVDLLTGPVAPGEQVTTGVNVELGKRPAGVEAVGGSWTIDAVTFEDRASSTWIEVKATNTGATAARFVGMVEVP
jgi:hypothetical protein